MVFEGYVGDLSAVWFRWAVELLLVVVVVVVAATGAPVVVVPAAAVGSFLRKLVGVWAVDSTLDQPLGRVALEKRDAFQE